jgi:hypothetical protein
MLVEIVGFEPGILWILVCSANPLDHQGSLDNIC